MEGGSPVANYAKTTANGSDHPATQPRRKDALGFLRETSCLGQETVPSIGPETPGCSEMAERDQYKLKLHHSHIVPD